MLYTVKYIEWFSLYKKWIRTVPHARYLNNSFLLVPSFGLSIPIPISTRILFAETCMCREWVIIKLSSEWTSRGFKSRWMTTRLKKSVETRFAGIRATRCACTLCKKRWARTRVEGEMGCIIVEKYTSPGKCLEIVRDELRCIRHYAHPRTRCARKRDLGNVCSKRDPRSWASSQLSLYISIMHFFFSSLDSGLMKNRATRFIRQLYIYTFENNTFPGCISTNFVLIARDYYSK